MLDNALVRTQKDELHERFENKRRLGSLRKLIEVPNADDALLLLDVSGSMSKQLPSGERAIDALRRVVADVRKQVKVRALAFGVAGGVELLPDDEIPEPCGGTPLAAAIAAARELGKKHLIVLSDGIPDNPALAKEEAEKFKGRLDAIYVADGAAAASEHDYERQMYEKAATFMTELAALTGGTGTVGDLTKGLLVATVIKGFLMAPPPPSRVIEVE